MRLYLSSYRLGRHPEALVKLMRGATHIGVIPNAGDGYKTDDPNLLHPWLDRESQALRDIGLEPHVFDLKPYFKQPAQHIRTALAQFDALWVLGGNSFVLRRAFRLSGFDEVLPGLLQADELVYAGYSAGIDQLCPSLHGVELVDDPHHIPDGYPNQIIWDGLGLLPYSIAPHYKSDHPEAAAMDDSVQYLIDHHLPFIALRDGEEIIVDGEVTTITSVTNSKE